MCGGMRAILPFMSNDPVVAVLRLQGVIATGSRGTLSDISLASMIEKAFRRGKPRAVALIINSPGGSPAQSSLIAGRIRRLSGEKGVPVIAFVEDVAASGGYWLATAADEIYGDPTSIVGSIGVISAGFGFHDFIGRYGIERRVYTAGRSKSFLDPFRPEKDEDVSRLRAIQDQLHETFIAHVKERRGAKLNGEDLFTGDIWVGEAARDVGLIDGIAHMVPEMKRRFGEKVRFVRYERRRSIFSRLGAEIVADGLAVLEDRLARARFGL